jgi:hypothetical protein
MCSRLLFFFFVDDDDDESSRSPNVERGKQNRIASSSATLQAQKPIQPYHPYLILWLNHPDRPLHAGLHLILMPLLEFFFRIFASHSLCNFSKLGAASYPSLHANRRERDREMTLVEIAPCLHYYCLVGTNLLREPNQRIQHYTHNSM